MSEDRPVHHRLKLNNLTSSLSDPRLTRLIEDGYTVFSSWQVQEGDGDHEVLLLLRPPVPQPEVAQLVTKLDEVLAEQRKPVDLRRLEALLAAAVVSPWLVVGLQAAGLL